LRPNTAINREFAAAAAPNSAGIICFRPSARRVGSQEPVSSHQTYRWADKSASNCRKPPPNPARGEASHKRVNAGCRAFAAGNRPFGRRYRPNRGRIRAAFAGTGHRKRLRLGLGRFFCLVLFGRAPRAAGRPHDDRRLSLGPLGDPQGLHPQSPAGSDHGNASARRSWPRWQASRDCAGAGRHPPHLRHAPGCEARAPDRGPAAHRAPVADRYPRRLPRSGPLAGLLWCCDAPLRADRARRRRHHHHPGRADAPRAPVENRSGGARPRNRDPAVAQIGDLPGGGARSLARPRKVTYRFDLSRR
jgi:hypothetical protein